MVAPDKFGSTWLAKCQETHEGARRSNRPGNLLDGAEKRCQGVPSRCG